MREESREWVVVVVVVLIEGGGWIAVEVRVLGKLFLGDLLSAVSSRVLRCARLSVLVILQFKYK